MRQFTIKGLNCNGSYKEVFFFEDDTRLFQDEGYVCVSENGRTVAIFAAPDMAILSPVIDDRDKKISSRV